MREDQRLQLIALQAMARTIVDLTRAKIHFNIGKAKREAYMAIVLNAEKQALDIDKLLRYWLVVTSQPLSETAP